MVICTTCGREADRGETFCARCGAFLEWTGAPATPAEAPPLVMPAASSLRYAGSEPEQAGPPVVSTLSAYSIRVEPGGEASITVEVRNQGRTVDQLLLEVQGPAAAWSSVEPPRLNLMPGMSAVATIASRPPRSPAVRAGDNPLGVAIRSSQHPDARVIEQVAVEVAPFMALDTTLAPSVLRGVAAAATALRATNGGNTPVELTLGGDDPEMAFEILVNPPTLRVEPGAAADALVVVKPREPLQSGPDRTRPFRVLVTASDGYRRVLDGTFVQAPVPAPPPPPEPAPTGPPLVATLSSGAVRVEPGGQAGVTVEVINRRRTADRVSLEVRGPTAAWASVEPARLNVAPEASAAATISFHPPRISSMQPGRYPADVTVSSHEHPDAFVVNRVVVDVIPFVAFETSLAPSVLRGSREATSKLRVANSGNTPVELLLGGGDPEEALQFRISPLKLRLKPGAAGNATVVVKARKANRSRADLARPFRVFMTAGDGSRPAGDGTFIQPAPRGRRRWPWVFALFGLLGVAALVVASLYPPGQQPRPAAAASTAVSPAPVSPAPVSPAPVSPAPVSAAPVSPAPAVSVLAGPDIGGRYYLDPGNSRIIIINAVGENRYTIEEQQPANWPFMGTLDWLGGDDFAGPATFASGTKFRVELKRQPDGWLVTNFVYISDDQGNPITRTDSHQLVPAS